MSPNGQSLELHHSAHRVELKGDSNKALDSQAMARLAQRLGKHGDAERLCLEAIKPAKHVSDHSNALVAALVCGAGGF